MNPASCMMLHSVGKPDPKWAWQHLTMPWQAYENMLRCLRRKGYRSVTLDEYREICLQGRLREERVVALTFDDGYLDNWVYVAPLLQAYGFQGTVFVSTDFIDPGERPRPQWSPAARDVEPPSSGFLNKAELRLLDHSGVLAVESHAATHTWYPSGPRIVDFRHPEDAWYWMNWNADPAGKWQHLAPACPASAWGEPVYEHQKALQGPRFFPNPAVAEELRAYVSAESPGFFHSPGWRDALRQKTAEVQAAHHAADGLGEWESEEHFLARAEDELARSARILGELLGKTIRHLCWPGGGYSPGVFSLAAAYYASTTIASSDTTAEKGRGAREHGAHPHTIPGECLRIRRFGPLTVGQGERLRYLGAYTNTLYIEERRLGGRLSLARLIRGGLTRLAQWGMV